MFKIFTNGIIKQNPVLRLLLGACPTLAITTMAINGVGMGLAATFVLVCSNAVISMLRNVIPDKIRIPSYITIIAGFVTIVQFIIKAYAPAIDQALGIYLPLIVVNCIILGRAEIFAGKNKVLPSVLDGLGMGIGFTATLVVMGAIRELLGSGTLFGVALTAGAIEPMILFILPPGGFFVFGMLIALVDRLTGEKKKGFGCMNCAMCPSALNCEEAKIKPAESGETKI